MKKFILHLRKKPEHIRIQILYVLITVSTVIMFSFWVYSLGVNNSNSDMSSKLKQDLKPFSMLKDGIVNSAKDLSWPLSSTNGQ